MSSANASNVGDVVQLASGGPKMTVKQVTDKTVKCIWFANPTDTHPVEYDFEPELLKPAH